MPIQADDARPPHVQMADELREAIRAGEYGPGKRLPSTRELMKSYGVANMTAQAAIRVLREEGLVESQPGRGVFVQQRRGDPQTAGPGGSSVSETLDRAQQMLAEANELLSEPGVGDDLSDVRAALAEANELLAQRGARVPPPEPDVGPAADPTPGVEP